MSLATIPAELQQAPQWLLWKLEDVNGRATKVPYNLSGRKASTTNPKDWTDFETAQGSFCEFEHSGLGCVIAPPFVGIDFDKCRNPQTGAVDPWALEAIKMLDSYTELSPSGKGFHIWVKGAVPAGGNRRGLVEMYSNARYFTMTGEHYQGTPTTINRRDLTAFHKKYILAANTQKSEAPKDNSPSATEWKLACDIAKQLGPSAAFQDVKLEFLSRAEFRKKWDDNKTYLDRTIANAIEKVHGKVPVSSAAKQIVVEYASGTKTRRYQWLWPARLPLGKLALFVGNPDNGKSLTTVEVAAIVSTGREWPDCPNRLPASKVLMLVGEDDIEDTTVPRLQAAGADLDNILFLKSVILSEGLKNTQTEREVQLDADLIEIKRVLSEHPEIRLITIDPISNYLGRTKMVAEQEVRAILIPLKNLAAEMSVCVLGVMHLNKKIDLGAINRIGGAMAFVGVARAVWLFAREDENPDQLYMLRVKNNNAKRNGGLIYQIEARPVHVEGADEWMPAVKWIGQIDKSADDVLAKRAPGRPAEQRDEAATWLMDFLKSGPQLRTKVEEYGKESHGFSLRTLERAKDKIGARAIKQGKKWYWTLETDPGELIM